MGKKFGPLLTLPELEPGDDRYIEAFNDLSRARSFHMSGPNPIAIADMQAYWDMCGTSDHPLARQAFLRTMLAVDAAYMDYMAEDLKRRRA